MNNKIRFQIQKIDKTLSYEEIDIRNITFSIQKNEMCIHINGIQYPLTFEIRKHMMNLLNEGTATFERNFKKNSTNAWFKVLSLICKNCKTKRLLFVFQTVNKEKNILAVTNKRSYNVLLKNTYLQVRDLLRDKKLKLSIDSIIIDESHTHYTLKLSETVVLKNKDKYQYVLYIDHEAGKHPWMGIGLMNIKTNMYAYINPKDDWNYIDAARPIDTQVQELIQKKGSLPEFNITQQIHASYKEVENGLYAVMRSDSINSIPKKLLNVLFPLNSIKKQYNIANNVEMPKIWKHTAKSSLTIYNLYLNLMKVGSLKKVNLATQLKFRIFAGEYLNAKFDLANIAQI